jgi:hypothetical protein
LCDRKPLQGTNYRDLLSWYPYWLMRKLHTLPVHFKWSFAIEPLGGSVYGTLRSSGTEVAPGDCEIRVPFYLIPWFVIQTFAIAMHVICFLF